MNKAKKLLVLSLVAFGAASTAGCTPFWKRKKGGEEETETMYFSFSVGLKSGANIIQLGNNGESVVVYDNGIDTADRSYSYSSTDESVATIDQSGKITPIKEGRVNFKVSEAKSETTKTLNEKSFVSHFEEQFRFVLNLFVGKYRAFECGVILSERAVNAVVRADIAEIKRRKEDDSFAVNYFFCFSCSLENLVALFFILDVEQNSSVLEVKPFELHCAVEHFIDLAVGDFLVDKAVKFLSVDKNLFSVQ